MADKASLRAKCKALEREMTQQERLESDLALQRNFLRLPQLAKAKTVLLYHSMGFEADTGSILDELHRQGRNVLLPRCLPGGRMEARRYDPEKMARHRYGMWEPTQECEAVDRADIDLILVPAVCYDRARRRLGRGGGFYDRYLDGYHGFTVGLCRERLLQDSVPREDWDIGVDLVLTERTLIGR